MPTDQRWPYMRNPSCSSQNLIKHLQLLESQWHCTICSFTFLCSVYFWRTHYYEALSACKRSLVNVIFRAHYTVETFFFTCPISHVVLKMYAFFVFCWYCAWRTGTADSSASKHCVLWELNTKTLPIKAPHWRWYEALKEQVMKKKKKSWDTLVMLNRQLTNSWVLIIFILYHVQLVKSLQQR